jgi:hypothetical protein
VLHSSRGDKTAIELFLAVVQSRNAGMRRILSGHTEQPHGRERRFRPVPVHLGPVRDWIAHYERLWDDHLQRLQKDLTKGDEK